MKIGIIGYGFVGRALEKAFTPDVDVIKIDPKLNTCIDDLQPFKPDAIFICVPTPMKADSSQDLSILEKVLHEILELKLDALIILKSTVLPNSIKEIEAIIPDFIYNPEFLREKHAEDDFINASLIIFGGSSEKSFQSIANIYTNFTRSISTDYIYTDVIAASLIKYSINSFLAVKVTFFNELHDVFKLSNTNESWDKFINAISKDARIGSSHMNVPGHDGRKGYGGACLPKDSNAFFLYSDNLNSPLNLLKNTININNNIRKLYNSETTREKEQNIKFQGDDN